MPRSPPKAFRERTSGITKQGTLFPLLAAGLLSETLYLFLALAFPLPRLASTPLQDLGKLTRYQWGWALLFSLILGCLFGLFFLAWRAMARNSARPMGPMILAFAGLFQLTLLWMYPVTAGDIFDYIAHARVWVRYGANPLVIPPAAFPEDPFLPLVIWQGVPAVYGPLWLLASGPLAALAGDHLLLSLVLEKLLVIVSILGSSLLIWWMLRDAGPATRNAGLLFFAWNPLVVFETGGNGHNDALMVLLLLGSLSLLQRHNLVAAQVALIASALVKFTTLLLLPVFLLHIFGQTRRSPSPVRPILGGTIAMGAATVLAYAPFWEGLQILAPLFLRSDLFTSSLGTLLVLALRATPLAPQAILIAKGITGGLFLLLALGLIKRWGPSLKRWEGLLRTSFWVLLAYLFLAAWWFQAWYLIWLLALAALVSNEKLQKLAFLFSMTASFSYVHFIYVWGNTGWGYALIQGIAVVLIFGIPTAYGLPLLKEALLSPPAAIGKANQR